MDTQQQEKLKRLAKSCRELAIALDQGEIVQLEEGYVSDVDGGPWCAFGHALARAGFTLRPLMVEATEVIEELTGYKASENHVLTSRLCDLQAANDLAPANDRAAEVVAPLLYLADELEATY